MSQENDDRTLDERHRQEQAEAAFQEACETLSYHSQNFLVFVRTGKGRYLRHIEGKNHAERICLASGVATHLNDIIAELGLLAAERVDIEDEERGMRDA
jgi:hypothetical protein